MPTFRQIYCDSPGTAPSSLQCCIGKYVYKCIIYYKHCTGAESFARPVIIIIYSLTMYLYIHLLMQYVCGDISPRIPEGGADVGDPFKHAGNLVKSLSSSSSYGISSRWVSCKLLDIVLVGEYRYLYCTYVLYYAVTSFYVY